MKRPTIAILAIPLLGGCGSASPDQQLRGAWQESRAAVVAKDTAAFCALLSDGARREIEEANRDRSDGCRPAIGVLFTALQRGQKTGRDARLVEIRVAGDTALTVDASPSETTTSWVREGDRWRIVDID